MYERRNERPISRDKFRLRVFMHVLVALGVVAGSILIGMIGFVLFEGMPWSRGALNATTLISGLGLAEVPETPIAQIYTSLFALYAGFVFVAASGIVIAPIAHRILHKFHWADDPSRFD